MGRIHFLFFLFWEPDRGWPKGCGLWNSEEAGLGAGEGWLMISSTVLAEGFPMASGPVPLPIWDT